MALPRGDGDTALKDLISLRFFPGECCTSVAYARADRNSCGTHSGHFSHAALTGARVRKRSRWVKGSEPGLSSPPWARGPAWASSAREVRPGTSALDSPDRPRP